MKKKGENSGLLRLSRRCFERLLVIYPQEHRAEYGPAMAQLFYDQCRDAWRDFGWRGLLMLWLRILPDLLKTSLLEHLAHLKGKKSMLNKIFTGIRPSSAGWGAFILTFGFIFMMAVMVTLMLPKIYSSRTLIKIERDSMQNPRVYDPYYIQTELEVIQSDVVLDKVIEKLDLNERWRVKYGAERELKTSESRMTLQRMIELRPVRNTSLIDIGVYSRDKQEAAAIANAIAESYRGYREEHRAAQVSQASNDVTNRRTAAHLPVQIIELAEPSAKPVRPNKPLNISLGAFVGGMLGLFVGGIAAFVASRMQQRQRNSPPPIPQAI